MTKGSTSLRLKSIRAEEKACRIAWSRSRGAELGAHVHHNAAFEQLSDPYQDRMDYILAFKPERERALRLRLFRPVPSAALTPELRVIQRKIQALERKITAVVDQPFWISGVKFEDLCDRLRTIRSEMSASALSLPVREYHDRFCALGARCPWNGRSIFPDDYKLGNV